MPLNRHALIRYKTIDNCLSNRFRRWTLKDLQDACTEALNEYEGVSKRIGLRTIQGDIQVMRSDKLGYNAPIKVVDRKYYVYDDPDYSIMNNQLSKQDMDTLSEVSSILKQFVGFNQLSDVQILIQKLEDTVQAGKGDSSRLLDLERNENLQGLEYIAPLYRALSNKEEVHIWYQSFQARRPGKIVFHPYLLKEYRNRWFLLGKKYDAQSLMTLALDRIKDLDIQKDKVFQADINFDPENYYRDVIGVTLNAMRPVNVHLLVDHKNAPYVLTKPLHHSQQEVGRSEKGVEIAIKVIPNFELEREILGFGESVEVLAPLSLRRTISAKLKKAAGMYGTLWQKQVIS